MTEASFVCECHGYSLFIACSYDLFVFDASTRLNTCCYTIFSKEVYAVPEGEETIRSENTARDLILVSPHHSFLQAELDSGDTILLSCAYADGTVVF